MNSILQILLGFCAAAVFIGAISMLTPASVMEKPTKFVISLVFTVVVVTLFSSIKTVDLQLPAASSNVEETSGEMFDFQVEYLCSALLDDNNITYNKISAKTNIKSDGDIYIREIIVYSSQEPKKITSIIKEAFSAERVDVINE